MTHASHSLIGLAKNDNGRNARGFKGEVFLLCIVLRIFQMAHCPKCGKIKIKKNKASGMKQCSHCGTLRGQSGLNRSGTPPGNDLSESPLTIRLAKASPEEPNIAIGISTMTKPRNFPERKRQRQIGALGRLPLTREKTGKSTDDERNVLEKAVAQGSRRSVHTKKIQA